MGFVDRGGGREAKGSSLRRSKKNPGAPSTRNKGANKKHISPPTRATPIPPPVCLPFVKELVKELRRQRGSSEAVADDKETQKQQEEGVDAAATEETSTPSVVALVKQVRARQKDAVKDEAGCALATARNIDAAVAILSRKLEDDREGIFRRAVEDGHLAAMLCWCNEMERQDAMLEACRSHSTHLSTTTTTTTTAAAEGVKKVRFQVSEESAGSGSTALDANVFASSDKASGDCALYCLIGVHVNNIDRMNKKFHEQWITDITSQGKNSQVLGILSGLNLSRDAGTHFAQEWMLRECWRVAGELRLPLVLHVYSTGDESSMQSTVDRAAELLTELMVVATTRTGAPATANPTAVVLYNGIKVLASSAAMRHLVKTHRPASAVSVALNAVAASSHTPPVPSLTAVAGVEDEGTAKIPFYVIASAEGLTEAREEEGKKEEGKAAAEGVPAGEGESSKTEKAVARKDMEWVALLPSLLEEEKWDEEDSNGEDTATETAVVALSQLIVGSGSPWGTPQNIEDPYLRTLPNEPGNYQYVMRGVYDALEANSAEKKEKKKEEVAKSSAERLSFEEVEDVCLGNFLSVFFADFIAQQVSGNGADNTTTISTNAAGEEEESDSDGDGNEEAAQGTSALKHHHYHDCGGFILPSITGIMSLPGVSTSSATYTCRVCRASLFRECALATHSREAPRVHRGGKKNQQQQQQKPSKVAESQKRKGKSKKGERGARTPSESDDDEFHHGERGEEDDPDYAKCGQTLVLCAVQRDDSGEDGDEDSDDDDDDDSGSHLHIIGELREKNNKSKKNSGGICVEATQAVCGGCGTKIGNVRENSPCHCGVKLPGITIRVMPAKVDRCEAAMVASGTNIRVAKPLASSSDAADAGKKVAAATAAASAGRGPAGNANDDDDDLQALLEQAAREREELEREKETLEARGNDDDDGNSKKKREKKKNVKANNRSNFTHFRNKDFAPRQSRAEKLAHQREIESLNIKKDEEASGSDDESDGSSSAAASASEDESGSETETQQRPQTMAPRRARKKDKKRQQQMQQYRGGEDSD